MTPFLSALLLLLSTIAAAAADTTNPASSSSTTKSSSKKDPSRRRRRKNDDTPSQPHKRQQQQVKTTLCVTHDCNDDNGSSELLGVCKTYLTPLHHCYNAQGLFPDDESWSDVDLFDELHDRPSEQPSLKRTFHTSKDGSCSEVDYSLDLDFEVCQGPFGPPRPWGKFSLEDDSDRDDVENNDVLDSSLNEQEKGFSAVVAEE